mmetsp:Transcript_2013/g.5660  ORF Transcript_2013/g.5660 Transcript_2013/m.5660 type:complete len:411 (+) Transcript_2013:125-1357(+)
MLTPLLLFAHAAALPRPPFRFPGANVLYQPTFVRAEAARAVTPRGVSLVSLFGWTLGGVFVADWVDSPIGRYREVAVLSGLVFRGGTLGAWASHIVVSEAAAVEAAREFWGLPAREGDIQLQPLEAAGPPRGPRVHFESGSRVVVEGWCGEGEGEARSLRPPSFTLPSLSGGLPASGGLAAGPILRYPLTLTAPRRAALLPRLALSSSSLTTAPLRAVLDAPAASPCLRLDGVDVEAGAAEEVAAGRADAGVEPARLSPMLVVLDSCVLTLYALFFAIVGLCFSGEAFVPPGLPTLQDAKEIAFTFDTCASHVVAWGVSAAASGALAEDWLSLPADEHASAPGGVARVVVAWLLSVPLFEFLRALAALSIGPIADDTWPTAAGISYPGGSVGTLAMMVWWRRWLLDATPR